MKARLAAVKLVKAEQLGELIECFCQAEFCFKLTEEEAKVYGVEGFLFPSLRPRGEYIALERPSIDKKTLGMIVRAADGKYMGNNFFFRLQMITRYKNVVEVVI